MRTKLKVFCYRDGRLNQPQSASYAGVQRWPSQTIREWDNCSAHLQSENDKLAYKIYKIGAQENRYE